MADFGYDIADYRAVDPLFGTLADFDRLLAKAHAPRPEGDDRPGAEPHLERARLVHRKPRATATNPKADWYVWADARPDGTPPNNWLSIFGGIAWKWEPRRAQYYLHNFLVAQPDLNFHNPQVRARRARQPALLARPRRRWRASRRDQLLLPRPAAARQSAEAGRASAPAAASAPTIRTRTSTTTTTTRSPENLRVPRGAARAGRSLSRRASRSARFPPKIPARRWPSTRGPGACTWATASSCWRASVRRRTSAPPSRARLAALGRRLALLGDLESRRAARR